MTQFLSSDQISAWQRDGFLLIEGFLSPEACAFYKAHADRLVQDLQAEWQAAIFSTRNQALVSNQYFLDSGSKISIFMEEDAPDLPNKLGHALHDLDPQFNTLCRKPEMAQIAQDIGFERPLLLQSMVIFKHPGFGGEVKAHQDSTFLNTEPGSVVGFWMALDAANTENACLWAIPGGHREPLRSKMQRDGKGGVEFISLDSNPLPESGYLPLEVPQGTLVLLHGQLPHKSEANRSDKSRYAFSLHVIEGNAQYGAENWLQRPAEMPLRGFEQLPC